VRAGDPPHAGAVGEDAGARVAGEAREHCGPVQRIRVHGRAWPLVPIPVYMYAFAAIPTLAVQSFPFQLILSRFFAVNRIETAERKVLHLIRKGTTAMPSTETTRRC
jgi:hypothetical protein